ncbi:MAG: hydrogenase maturation protease [bacterium]|nr:hydrogenase maturation protease [bacterium]
MMNKVLIIGIGNTLRGDDGIAAEVLRRLEAEHVAADCRAVHQLTVEMAQLISQYNAVLLIDASVTLPVGHWRCEKIDHHCDGTENFSHDLSPRALLNLSTQLYASHSRAQVLSVGAERFDLTESISPEILSVLPMILDFVRAWPLTVSTTNHPSTQTEFESCSQII